MIISEAEIRKCIKNIELFGSRPCSEHMLLSPADRTLVEAYRRSMEKLPSHKNTRLTGVKKAVDSSAYLVNGSDVAEKMLGRVISDKLR